MKSKLKYVFVLLIIAVSVIAQGKTEFRKIKNTAFVVGEKLTFDVKYGFIKAGVAEMSIPTMKRISGREVYHVTFQVNSLPSLEALYRVRDRYETYLDKEGLFPWRFEQHIREGGYKRDFSAFFDQRNGKAKTSEGSYDIPEYVNDIVSAFYLARTFDYSKLKIGDRFNLQNFYKDKVYPLDVVYKGKETIDVEPLVQEGGLFKSEGNIIIWLSDDDLKIPIKVKTKVLIGSIDAELTGYEGLAGKFKSKK